MHAAGPLRIGLDSSGWNNFTLELNPNSWTKVANVIFLDLPAGAGFSYARTWDGWRSSDSILALHCYEFLKKWFMEHPRFVNNPLYISGISYMGILVPTITMEVYKGNEDGNQPKLNIKGCLILNPLIDRFIDFNSRLEFAFRVALISDDMYKSTKEACQGNYVYNHQSNTLCAYKLQRFDECTSDINFSNILKPVCDDTNPDPDCLANTKETLDAWANKKEVQKALYVREGTIDMWEKTNNTIHYAFGKNDTINYSYDIFSIVDYHKQLTTRNCQVLVISGDHDMTFPHVRTEQWIKSLNVPIESPWNPWFVDNQVSGYQMTYAKSGYSLAYATIKGAGHSVSSDKPTEVAVLVARWFASHAYISDS